MAEISNLPFFRLFRVTLDKNCKFFDENKIEGDCNIPDQFSPIFGLNEPGCSLSTDLVDTTISKEEK